MIKITAEENSSFEEIFENMSFMTSNEDENVPSV